MNLQEFIENNNHNYKNMKFFYEYYTRNSFFSFAHAASCKKRCFVVPSKDYHVHKNKLFITCRKASNPISFELFTKRDYPRDLDVIFSLPTHPNTLLELDINGYSTKDGSIWNYELEETSV